MGKFNANNLSYSQDLPPFLAALHGQYSDRHGGGPDPILASQRRSAKKRSASEEAEDAPLVLDVHGDVVAGVAFGKDGTATMVEGEEEEDEKEKDGGKKVKSIEGAMQGVDGVAGIGAGKKKRVGRVIGGGGSNDNNDDDDNNDAARRKRKRPAREDDDNDKKNGHGSSGKPKEVKDTKDAKSKTGGGGKDKKKKKAKKIQLSFEDDEDDG